jgi:glutamyl-tRNA synthetase
MVRGHMCVPVDSLSDPVIVKSNGIPTYNFAVVLDDHEMQITNVLRGSEHIANTPYQIAIMRALGYDDKQISFGHLTIIVDETGKKLSKRNKDLKQFILSVDGDDYIHIGYHPKGILNFISLLG